MSSGPFLYLDKSEVLVEKKKRKEPDDLGLVLKHKRGS